MTIKALYPTVRPTLNLDFAKTKVLDPRVTFTRASTATFVGSNGLIQTAASGAARFDHNPTTGESLGLLVEEARTNLATYSEQFDNAAWFKVNATVTPNQALAPDGTLTMDELVDNATNGTHRCAQSFTPPSSNFTISAYVKYKNTAWVYLHYFVYGCAFNIQTGEVGTPTANAASPSIIPIGNGVYRISVNITNSVGVDAAGLGLSTGNSIFASYIGTGSSAFIWGFQAEAGAFPTSYIPTTSATVTRAADVASITGTNFSSWYNQSAGTFFADYKRGPRSLMGIVTGLPSEFGPALIADERTSRGFTTRNGSAELFDNASVAIGANVKQIGAYNVASPQTSLCVNGRTVVSAAAYSSTPTGITIGGTQNSNYLALNSTIARLAFYPVRISDGQLQALTAT